MTLWACYVRSGKEFEAQEEAQALGITCHVPRRVDMIRQGKRRRPDPVVKPFLPNYVFCDLTDQQWHAVKSSKHIRSLMGIGTNNARQVMQFIARVEADYRLPIFLGDAVKVEVRCPRIGRSSFDLAYRVVRNGSLLLAEGQTVQVMIDFASGRPTVIGEATRSWLESQAGG